MNILNKLLIFIKTNSKTYLLASLGFISLLCLFHIRFIRKRFPQDIPFILTELRFYIILFICITLVYIIKINIKPKMPNEYLQKVMQYIGLPFATFDNLLKTNKYSLSYIKEIIEYSFPKKYWTQILITIFLQLIPRIMLIIIFLLDVFWFHRLYYFYYFLFLGIFPWLYIYYKYSMYHAKELGLLYLEMLYDNVDVFEEGWADLENNFEFDEDGEITEKTKEWKPHPRNKYHEKIMSIRKYFEISVEKLIDETENDYDKDDYYTFEPAAYSNDKRLTEYQKVTGIVKLTTKDYNILEKNFNDIMPLLVRLSYKLHYLPFNEKKFYMDKINLIIVILWFIAWTYILIKSIHTLENIEVTLKILAQWIFYFENTNPFND